MMIIKCDNVTDNIVDKIKLQYMCSNAQIYKTLLPIKRRYIIKPIFNSPNELEQKLNDYFQETSNEELTLSGLVLALGTNKQTLANYQKKPEYVDLINHAKLRIENSYELSLRKNGRSADIFALKNFGWSDKKVVHYSEDNTTDKLDFLIRQLSGGENEE
jgi:hypothetical protein